MTADLLKAARALCARGPCRGTQALDTAGVPVSPTSRRAVRFDPEGGLLKASGEALGLGLGAAIQHPEYQAALGALERAAAVVVLPARPFGPSALARYADNATLGEVLDLFDAAIGAVEGADGRHL